MNFRGEIRIGGPLNKRPVRAPGLQRRADLSSLAGRVPSRGEKMKTDLSAIAQRDGGKLKT